MAPLAWFWRKWWVRRIVFPLVIFMVVVEILSHLVLRRSGLDQLNAIQVGDKYSDDPIVAFDPVLGMRFLSSQARTAILTPNGEMQTWGRMRGNNLGLLDTSDFSPKRKDPKECRVAVLGDSMSAGVELARNWPQRAEEVLREQGRHVELLNFSVPGAGVMNWWSILTRLIEEQSYELDGIVFAVCRDDLYRGFFITHDAAAGAEHRMQFGRVQGLAPEDLPRTLADANRHFFSWGPFLESNVVSPVVMDEIIENQSWTPPKSYTPATLKLARLLLLAYHFREQGKGEDGELFNAQLQKRILEMASVIEARKYSCMVVEIPLLENSGESPSLNAGIAPATWKFAEMLSADVLDGRESMTLVSPEEWPDLYLVGDRHWNQKGSDRFGEWMASRIEEAFASSPDSGKSDDSAKNVR